ncbi:MAG: glycosyltransferase [Thermoguttaceae bacterium]|nr:glycosyltransferase [Thermoguttaceae bacterium]
MPPTASVALITFNGAKYLQEQLDSLTKQTVLPDELVVCDDGSTDATMEILHRFAETAPFPVRIFQNEKNLGFVGNFRKTFFLCEKEVTFFCDQDDIWLPEKMEKMLSVFEREPEVDLVLSYDHRVDAFGKRIPFGCHESHLTRHLEKENSFRTLFKRRRWGWAAHNMACRTFQREVLFRREEFLPVVFDGYIYMMLGFLSQVRVVPEVCMYFRRHGENATTRSGKVRNPLRRLWNSICRHSDIRHILPALRFWQDLVENLSDHEAVLERPEFLLVRKMQMHLKSRVRIHESFWLRLPLWMAELFSGRYLVCSNKPIRDMVSDLFAFPQKCV